MREQRGGAYRRGRAAARLGPVRRRQTAAVGGSIAIHAALLLLLAAPVLPHFSPSPSPRAAVDLQLVPNFATAPVRSATQRPPALRRLAPEVSASPAARLPQPPKTVPAQVAPRPGAAAPSAADAAPPSPPLPRPTGGQLPAAEMAPDLRGALRAIVGCSHQDYLTLSSAEKAQCDAQIAQAVRDAPSIDPIGADRRLHLDRAAASAARKRANMQGPLPDLFMPCPTTDPGSNLGIGCLSPKAVHHSSF